VAATKSGIYVTKTDFLMFLAGIIDAPNRTSPLAKKIKIFAEEDDTVLITGDTGTGKELHAKVIHYRSGRSKEKFMAINCAGIPDTLLESELFGYEKGAFTGADKKKIGMLEDVGRGTLFLDEIGDMPMPLQAKLLRVLQDKDFRMLGGRKTLYFEGRVIAATNSDLRKQISGKQFRKDLFYRLNVLPIELKSFNELSDKERKEAILNKLRHIIYEKSKQPGDYTILDYLSGEGPESQIEFDREGDYVGEVTPDNEFISDEALQYLLNYSFPGNYRELDNIIRRAYVLSERGRIEASVLPDEVRNPDKSASPQEEIKISDVDKVLVKDILDYAQDIKTDIVRRKIKSIYSKGQDLKSALRNEGIDKESDYQNINKKIVKIIGKEEMTRIRRGK
jgi:two-component system response regulator AtoC